jgi:hypothetical protein
MKTLFTVLCFCLFFGLTGQTFGQGGGKAEPNRISFKRGATSATVSGNLKVGEQMEYVFAATKGQSVSLKIVSTPKGKFHYFTVKGSDVDFASDYDINYDLTFTAPETGDYFVTVHLSGTDKVKRARFALSLVIKPEARKI